MLCVFCLRIKRRFFLVFKIFDLTDFNKQHATISAKNLNFSFILKLNKQQLADKAFKDVLMDNMYDYLILYLQEQSYDIAYPELCLPLIIRVLNMKNIF